MGRTGFAGSNLDILLRGDEWAVRLEGAGEIARPRVLGLRLFLL